MTTPIELAVEAKVWLINSGVRIRGDVDDVSESLAELLLEHRKEAAADAMDLLSRGVELFACDDEKLKEVVKERDDLAAALRLVAEDYEPCGRCGAPFAELWRWVPIPNPEYDEEYPTGWCGPCADAEGVRDACTPCEPADRTAELAKIRHLIQRAHVDQLGELANDSVIPNSFNHPEAPEGSP